MRKHLNTLDDTFEPIKLKHLKKGQFNSLRYVFKTIQLRKELNMWQRKILIPYKDIANILNNIVSYCTLACFYTVIKAKSIKRIS